MSDADRLSKLRHDLSNPLSALLAETQLLLLNEAQIDPTTVVGPQGDRGAGDPDADDAAGDLTPLTQISGQQSEARRAGREPQRPRRTHPPTRTPRSFPPPPAAAPSPPSIRTASRPLRTSASDRLSLPGATTDRPSRKPAAPATQMANSSSAPCPRMNAEQVVRAARRWRSGPRRRRWPARCTPAGPASRRRGRCRRRSRRSPPGRCW